MTVLKATILQGRTLIKILGGKEAVLFCKHLWLFSATIFFNLIISGGQPPTPTPTPTPTPESTALHRFPCCFWHPLLWWIKQLKLCLDYDSLLTVWCWDKATVYSARKVQGEIKRPIIATWVERLFENRSSQGQTNTMDIFSNCILTCLSQWKICISNAMVRVRNYKRDLLLIKIT